MGELVAAWTTTSTHPMRCGSSTVAAGRLQELLRRGLDVFGLASLAEQAEAPAEIVELAEERRRARAAKDLGRLRRARDAIAGAGWDVRDEGDGYRLVRRA